MITKEKIQHLYTCKNLINKRNNICLVFVYNSPDEIHDTLHISECITPIERDMIVNSFETVCDNVMTFQSEEKFIQHIPKLKQDFKHVYVYSMAQNVRGIGRRCLVPLLCDYYNLHNIGADFPSCYLGGNKKAMYDILSMRKELNFPFTKFITSSIEIPEIINSLTAGRYLIKPNDESASIGIEMIDVTDETRKTIISKLQIYIVEYSIFCIQEFLNGDEVEVPVLYNDNDYFCPGVCKIEKSEETAYLNYNTIALEEYHFSLYNSQLNELIKEQSIIIAKILDFKSLSRIDYIISNNKPYIIDIGPNPTISEHSSTNFLFKNMFSNDERAVYILLLISYFSQDFLLKPAFNKPQNDWMTVE